MNDTPRPQRTLWQIFCWPLLFGVLSIVGLIAALVGDGLWDLLSWLCLTAVVGVLLSAVRPMSKRR